MKEYSTFLKTTKLFAGIGEEEISDMTDCLDMTVKHYGRGEPVYRSGEYVRNVAVLAEGILMIQKDDYWGNRSIVNHISPGEVFGEAYAMQNSEAILNDVIAQEDSTVLFFNVRNMLVTCKNSCRSHTQLIENLVQCVCLKNRILTQKIACMAKRSTREKLTYYLSSQAKSAGSPTFKIPFNRQQLADYLGVDRSAMSNELCKMRDDGMLTFDKSNFTLLSRKNSEAF